tara:strand:- start:3689 stop:5830 length:2142 start_codon:yes stop_codon:yes gene_type:complete
MSDLNLDKSQWRTFLEILGKDKNTVRLRSFYPKGHPLKNSDRGKKSNANVPWITQCQTEGRGIYVVVNDGEDTDSSITGCRAFFVEWDDRSKEYQINAWKDLGLPEPTLQIDTGGKSIHNYWVLKKSIDPKTWKPIQERLLDYADADRALKNPSRVMRLPGTYHMGDDGTKREMTRIISSCEKKYTVKDIEDCLPNKVQTEKIKKSKQFKEYRKGTFEDIKEALNCIPPRVPGSGTYDYYRNLLWGLVKACHDANRSESDAISLMQQHSPQWGGIDQVARSGGKLIEAGTFWYLARESGYNPPKLVEIKSIENPDTPVVMEKQPLQKIEANQLMEQLRKKNKGDKPFRYNIFTQQIEEGEEVCEGENSLERYYIKLADSGIKVSKDLAFDCVVQAARENEYDPVKEYLLHVSNTEELTYIDQLATTYLRPEDKPIAPTIYDKMLKCTLIAAVARVFEPGCKFDNCFVIVGKQGARKSTFWSTLGGPFFSDALKDISNKDSLMVLHRSWIMEYSELDFLTTRKQAGEVKAFLSQATDIFRVPYGKSTEVFKRRGIIVGTSNKTDGLLMDDSGNRRFWICQTTRDNTNQIDCDGLLKERSSIWASAVSAYLNKEPWTLDTESEEIVNNENVKYLIDSPWKSVVESYINEPKNRGRELTTEVVLTEAIEKPIERQTRGDQMQIASILRDLGLVKKRRGDRSSRKWVYIRDLDTISV